MNMSENHPGIDVYGSDIFKYIFWKKFIKECKKEENQINIKKNYEKKKLKLFLKFLRTLQKVFKERVPIDSFKLNFDVEHVQKLSDLFFV